MKTESRLWIIVFIFNFSSNTCLLANSSSQLHDGCDAPTRSWPQDRGRKFWLCSHPCSLSYLVFNCFFIVASRSQPNSFPVFYTLPTLNGFSVWFTPSRCPWCNGYRRRKWTQWHEFKSWTKLISFHIALIPLGKVWIQLFFLQLSVNSRADWPLQPWWDNLSRRRKTLNSNLLNSS